MPEKTDQERIEVPDIDANETDLSIEAEVNRILDWDLQLEGDLFRDPMD